MVQTQTPVFQPRATQPTPKVQLNLMGDIFYPPGPWGSARPIRNRASVEVYEGIIDPRKRHIHTPPGPGFVDKPALVTWGNIVTFRRGKRVSFQKFTDSDGHFSFVTDPVDMYPVGLVLEIIDYNPVSAGGELLRCVYQLFPDGPVDMAFPSLQGTGKHRVPWWPPQFMTALATIGGEVYRDTQKLSRKLCAFVRSPAYPLNISLSRESALDQTTSYTTGDDFTMGELLLIELGKQPVPANLPANLVGEMRKISRFASVQGTPAEAIATILDRLVTVNIQMLENGSFVSDVLDAISSVMGRPSFVFRIGEDPANDMAAACVFLAAAGTAAKDNAKVTVTSKSTKLSNDQKMLKIEVLLSK